MMASTPLIATEQLARALGAANLVVIDGSWRMPGARRRADGNPAAGARDDYERRHIPGAVFFPIDEIADTQTSLPHMLPPQGAFEAAVGALGVSERDRIVVYDDQGLFSAARVWWTFKAMGHKDVGVLDGGLPKWRAENRPVESGPVARAATTYRAAPALSRVADHHAVRRRLADIAGAVLDARPEPRFLGDADEPRPGLRRGHMPGAKSVPATSLVTPDGRLKDADSLRTAFAAAGVSAQTPVITSCGSGVTAAILSLALEALGHPVHALYDGSWAEWGAESNSPALFPVADGSGLSGQKD